MDNNGVDDDGLDDDADATSTNNEYLLGIIVYYYSRRAMALQLSCESIERRQPMLYNQRLQWEEFRRKYADRADFQRHLRLPYISFVKLLNRIRGKLEGNTGMANLRGGPIIPELKLYITVRFCAGGSYSDIMMMTGISTSSLYRCLWETIDAINSTPEFLIKFPQTVDECTIAARGFTRISRNDAIENCVAVVDGYHLQTHTPSKREVTNVRSFFSGHYQTYGVNIQAACDHNSRFVFIGVAGPGVMGDRQALNQVDLGRMVQNLPGFYCTIGDCAYTPTENLVPIYRGENAKNERNDNFNFYASQLRIRIEMAFGLMVKKWGILSRPLTIKMSSIKRLMVCIAHLHNFCIDERLENDGDRTNEGIYFANNAQFNENEQQLRNVAAEIEADDMEETYGTPWSSNRDRMAKIIAEKGLTRPGTNR
jgi:DDE superfamily endonuclease